MEYGADIVSLNDFFSHYNDENYNGTRPYRIFFPNNIESSSATKYYLFYNSPANETGFTQKPVYSGNAAKVDYLLRFYIISPELYKALKGIAAHTGSTEPNLANSFKNPIPSWSNVKGGLGYFGSCLIQYYNL